MKLLGRRGEEQTARRVIYDERGMIDMPFLILTLLLVGIGVIMMFSASYARAYTEEDGISTYYFGRQALFAFIGVAAMLFMGLIVDYHLLYKFNGLILLGTVILMLLVPIIGREEGGAKRWIWLGFGFQPSEVAKLTVIIAFSKLIADAKGKVRDPRDVLPMGIVWITFVVTLLLQKHLSAIIIVTGVAAAMLFMAGLRIRWFLLAGGILAALFFIYLYFMGYAAARFTAWLDPWADAKNSGYQIVQSLYAIGSGGLMGLGLGRSRQKYLYLPEEHNDYIFPIICEELGFVGAVLIILLFMLLILRGFWISLHAKDRFGALLAGGITTLLALQVIFNIGVVTNLLPATGISLPFFSYGGTALMMQLFEMGVVLSISRHCDNQLLAIRRKT